MQKGQVWEDFAALPVEGQQLATDFVAFLRKRYQKQEIGKQAKKTELSREPFIGMWSDREDMQSSTEWVRDMRKREWTR